MSKILKKCLVAGVSLLILASVGASANNDCNVSANKVSTDLNTNPKANKTNRRVRKNRRAKNDIQLNNKNINRHHGMKRIHRNHKVCRYNLRQIKKSKHNQRLLRHYNRKAHNSHLRLKCRGHKQRVYKARFKRSNNPIALQRSDFYDAYPEGGHFIFNKYAPNNKRAVVSKHANVSQWFQGTFGENGKYLSVFNYNKFKHGWLLVHKAQKLPKQNRKNVKEV